MALWVKFLRYFELFCIGNLQRTLKSSRILGWWIRLDLHGDDIQGIRAGNVAGPITQDVVDGAVTGRRALPSRGSLCSHQTGGNDSQKEYDPD